MFVDAPLGHTTGAPGDADTQRRLLVDGLQAGAAMTEPGIVDLPYRWRDEAWKADPLGWSRARQDAGTTGERSGDTRTGRVDTPVYQNADDAAAAGAVDWHDQCLVCLGPGFTDPA